MTMLRDMPQRPVARTEKLFETRLGGDYSYGELQLTAAGELILYTRDSGHWVALMVGEMVALYHQWRVIAAADVPRLTGTAAAAFAVVRERVPPGGEEHSIDYSKRFHTWLAAGGVDAVYESYDDYD